MKKRILMVSCEGLGNGGVQNVMMNIIRNLSHEYSFDMLLFTDGKRCFDDEMEKYGIIHRIPNKKTRVDYYIRFFRIFYGTYKLLKQNNYDIIHCNNAYESGICLLAAFWANVKVRVVHSHVVFNPKNGNFIRKIINKFYRLLLNKYSTNRISCSKTSGESIYSKKFDVVVNPIDLNRFDFRKRKKREDETINFVHVGRFCEIKNQVFIVEIISNIRKEIPNVRLTLVGYGDEYKEKIKAAIERHSLKENVDFLPHDADIPEILGNSDYMIFPSEKEGLGIALLEAQAMGVYCFSSTGVPEEANAGLCEFLDLNLGHKVWAERIVDYIKNEEKKIQAQNIRNYSIEVACSKIKEIYQGEKADNINKRVIKCKNISKVKNP